MAQLTNSIGAGDTDREARLYRTEVREDTDVLLVTHGPLTVTISRTTGALLAIDDRGSGVHARLGEDAAVPCTWEVGGLDARQIPARQPAYRDTSRIGDDIELRSWSLVRDGHHPQLDLSARAGEWELGTSLRFDPSSVRIRYSLRLTNRGDGERLLRSTSLVWPVILDNQSGWVAEIPGGRTPPALSLDQLPPGTAEEWRRYYTGMLDVGLIGLWHPAEQRGFAAWAFSRTQPVYLQLTHTESGLSLRIDVANAARLQPGEGVSVEGIWLEPFAGAWHDEVASFGAWWQTVDLQAPADNPDWTRTAAIYEVHIGTVLFKEEYSYAPYPTVADLLADLPRIKELGFDVIQIMPHHPFPSYTVHDFRDVSTSWGDEQELRQLVTAAHSQGVRVILDILLHGVLDREVVDRTVTSIHANELLAKPGAAGLAQYVLDFEASWRQQVVDVHPLVREHPEWFLRDEDGSIGVIYTNLFDLANATLQEWVITHLAYLIEELDIDGFRFDAPMWSELPNWDPKSPYPAAYPILGSIDLFDRARRVLKQLRPDVLFYTEPSGPLYRQSMDLTYNYDEQWLVGAVLSLERTANLPAWWRPAYSITAAGMAEWFAQRQLALPGVERTVHHVDSHDTFWWTDPGKKWRREQYGDAATSAMIAAFGLIEGGFMNYVGGEDGQETVLRKVLHLRKSLPELARGACDYLAVQASAAELFCPLRSYGSLHTVVAVNLSDRVLDATLRLPIHLLNGYNAYTVYDALGEEFIAMADGGLTHDVTSLSALAVGFSAYQPRALVLRPAGGGAG